MDIRFFTTTLTVVVSGIVKATVIGITTQTLCNPQFRAQVCRKPKCVKQNMLEDKLRSSVNLQGALKGKA